MNKSAIIEYRTAVRKNQEIFILNFQEEFRAFDVNNTALRNLGIFISTMRTKDDKSVVGLIPFILLMERQSTLAIDAFMGYQPFHAWYIYRPALEAFLVMGKLLDDPTISDMWRLGKDIRANRNNDIEKFRTYMRTFTGKGLESKSLPISKDILAVLSHINDNFMHLNWEYVKSSARSVPVDAKYEYVEVGYTIADEDELLAHVYSFIHLHRLLTCSINTMLVNLYGEHPALHVSLDPVLQMWAPKVGQLCSRKRNLADIVRSYGLWKI